MLRLPLSLVACILAVAIVYGQKAISVEDFSSRDTFLAKSISGINWSKDGRYYTTLQNNKIIKYNVTTGQEVETILDGSVFPEKIEIHHYTFSNDENKVLVITEKKHIYRRSYLGEYFVYDIPTKNLQKLSSGGKQSYATFSPDDSKIGFVRENNVFYVDLNDMKEYQITDDGKKNFIINGTTDWVYEEEFSLIEGFYWAPDGKKILYYRFDETNVKEYNMQMWNRKLYPNDNKFKYPKAGESNSEVELWVYNLETKGKIKADLGKEKDIYVPRVCWTQDPDVFAVRKLNRLQNDMELFHISAITGEAKLIIKEKSDTYTEIRFVEELYYLKDKKRFIIASESKGYKHLFLYGIDGKFLNQITSGNHEVINFHGVNEKTNMVYFTSTEVSPLERHFYYTSLDGHIKEKLSKEKGQHVINMSPDFQYYIDHFCSSAIPTIVTLFQVKGNKPIKVLERNEALVDAVKEYQLVPKEFFTFKSVDGIALHGYFLKPKDLIAGKKYPILLYQYSGPGSQNAGDSWAGNHFFFHQLLTQKGYIVAVVDTRGTGARGDHFKKLTYKKLGKFELEDLVTAAKYFSSLPYIDSSRIGIWGWSYGGYMTAVALTKSEGIFKMGIAVSPVISWRFYDTVYTEKFLQTPQLNPAGYDEYSPYLNAANLKGHFLMIHGTGDDNVHFQNAVAMEDALIHAGKQFRSFYYPDKNHAIPGPKTRTHLYTQMMEFVVEKL
jgi:dipeptidyl-peptidase 4